MRGSMRILAVAILLLFAGARSEAQLVSNERTMTLGTLEFTSSVAFVDDEKIIQTVVRVTNRGRDTTQMITPTPSCTVMLLIHREIRSTEVPVWDGRRKERVCALEARMWTIAPDSSVTFAETDSVAVVRRHTSPGVLYYFSALMYVGRLGSLELFTTAGRIP
jgi:hypothetical protein